LELPDAVAGSGAEAPGELSAAGDGMG